MRDQEAIDGGKETLNEGIILLALEDKFQGLLEFQPYPMDGDDYEVRKWRNLYYFPHMIKEVGARLSSTEIEDDSTTSQTNILSRAVGVARISHRESGEKASNLVDTGRTIVSKMVISRGEEDPVSVLGILWDITTDTETGEIEANLTTARPELLGMTAGSPYGGKLVQDIRNTRIPIAKNFKFEIGEDIAVDDLSKQRRVSKKAILGAGTALTMAGAAVVYVTHRMRKK